MARVQYGAIITDLKGKIGGQVFQGGNNSKVLRNNTYAKGTASLQRQYANSLVTGASTRWRGLSNAERTAWGTAALSWPFTDRFGNVYYGTGYQCFIAYSAGLTVIEEPAVDTPGAPVSAEAVGAITVDADSTTNIDVSIVANTTVVQALCIFMSAPVSAGVSGNNIRMKFLGVIFTSVANVTNLSASYNTAFGGRSSGSTIHWRADVRVLAYPRAVLSQSGKVLVS